MDDFPKALDSLIHELSRLPTVGRKSAQRLALHLLKADPAQTQELAAALAGLHDGVQFCRQCYFLAEQDLCSICADQRRDRSVICVVEEPADVIAFERSGSYRGLYHVLLGRLSPLQGVMPDDLKIQELLARLSPNAIGDTGGVESNPFLDGPEASPTVRVTEVILATSPTVDGDATALYLYKQLEKRGVAATRLGFGMPMGATLESIDELTIQKALEGRRSF